MIAYKLFREMKDGSIRPLFIGKSNPVPLGEWLQAEDLPTKGYAHRPGWHAAEKPATAHLSERGRRWYKVEIKDFYRFPRPKNQGGEWLIAKQMRVLEAV